MAKSIQFKNALYYNSSVQLFVIYSSVFNFIRQIPKTTFLFPIFILFSCSYSLFLFSFLFRLFFYLYSNFVLIPTIPLFTIFFFHFLAFRPFFIIYTFHFLLNIRQKSPLSCLFIPQGSVNMSFTSYTQVVMHTLCIKSSSFMRTFS